MWHATESQSHISLSYIRISNWDTEIDRQRVRAKEAIV